jgi:hypothetical protein
MEGKNGHFKGKYNTQFFSAAMKREADSNIRVLYRGRNGG